MNKKRFIAAVLAAALAAQGSWAFAAKTEDIHVNDSVKSESVESGSGISSVNVSVKYGQTEARKMLDMINEFRTGSEAWYWDSDDQTKVDLTGSLQELKYDENLEKIAMQRAAEIATSFSHTRPDGTICFTASSNGVYSFGENIAAGSGNAKSAFEMWQESKDKYSGQGHRRNMLAQGYKSIGIGYASVNGTGYWVQEFGGNDGSCTSSACDETVQKKIDIADNMVSVVEPIKDSITVQIGKTENISSDIKFRMKEYWGYGGTQASLEGINWSSKKEDVAKVSNNVVTGISEGSTDLTAEAFGKSITVKVNVTSQKSKNPVKDDKTDKQETDIKEDTKQPEQPQAHEHSYSEYKFIWDSNNNCDVQFFCEGCHDVQAIECDVTKDIEKASCTNEGKIVYTAYAVYKGKSYKDTKSVTIPKKGHNWDSGKVIKEADCTNYGEIEYRCMDCGYTYTERQDKTEHELNYVPEVPATYTKGGHKAYYICESCDEIFDDSTAEHMVTVDDIDTEKLILPKANIIKITSKNRSFKIAWERQNEASGYQIKYASNKGFTRDRKIITVNGNDKTKYSVSGIKAKKKYYVQIRSYRAENNKKVYSKWSETKTVKR